jgi:nucleoid DNA-binding protein
MKDEQKMTTYTKHDLIEDVAKVANITGKDATNLVETVLSKLTSAMLEEKRVEFRNFGIFEPVTRKSRIGRNPKDPNSKLYAIPEQTIIKFHMGKTLADHFQQMAQSGVSAAEPILDKNLTSASPNVLNDTVMKDI